MTRVTCDDIYNVGMLIFERKSLPVTNISLSMPLGLPKVRAVVMRLYLKGLVTLKYKKEGYEPIPYDMIEADLIEKLQKKHRPTLLVEPAYADEKEYSTRLDMAL